MIVLDPMLAYQTFDSTELTDFDVKSISSPSSSSDSNSTTMISAAAEEGTNTTATDSGSSSSLTTLHRKSYQSLSVSKAISKLKHMPVDSHTKQPVSSLL
jgi:hypothetical protein